MQIIAALMQRTRKAAARLAWDDVRLFLALCRARTLGGAAAVMGVDASTVSRRLAGMEEALSAALFSRGREGIAPTEAAERLMPVAEEIEGAIARFSSEAEGLERSISGLVRIACPPDLAEVMIAPLVLELRERHAAVQIEIHPGETVLDLTRREADVALRTVRPVRGDPIVTRLGNVRWVLVATPEMARALGALRSWDDAPWVGFGERLSSLAPARWLATHARSVDPVVRSDSLTLQIALARRGVGVALIPEPSVEHYGLARVRTSAGLREAVEAWPSDELFLVTHRALRQGRGLRDLLDRLREGQQPRAGQLVDLAPVPVLRQRGDRDVRDVLGVDERLLHAPGGQRHLAASHLIEEEAFTEVLAEPCRTQDGPLGAALLHRHLAEQRALLAAPGEEHQPPDATLHGERGELSDRLGSPGHRQVRVVRHVRRAHVSQGGAPRARVVPVERWLARAGANPDRDTPLREPLRHAPASLAGAAEHQRHLSIRHHDLPPRFNDGENVRRAPALHHEHRCNPSLHSCIVQPTDAAAARR
jgi:DNA-binding transcriptional LysR family regulator